MYRNVGIILPRVKKPQRNVVHFLVVFLLFYPKKVVNGSVVIIFLFYGKTLILFHVSKT